MVNYLNRELDIEFSEDKFSDENAMFDNEEQMKARISTILYTPSVTPRQERTGSDDQKAA
jgi:hypothetical protein